MSRERDFANAIEQGARQAGAEGLGVFVRDLSPVVVCEIRFTVAGELFVRGCRFTAQAKPADAAEWARDCVDFPEAFA